MLVGSSGAAQLLRALLESALRTEPRRHSTSHGL